MKPPGYEQRAATRADLPALGDLLSACDIAAVGGPDYLSEAWLRESWNRSRFDPADTVLVTARDGRVAAYAELYDEIPGVVTEAVGWVHPDHRGRGLGRHLIEATEAIADRREIVGLRLHNVIEVGDEPAHELLTAAGYDPVRRFSHMEIELHALSPAVGGQHGVRMRAFRPGDERTFHEVLETAFAQHWGFTPTSLEEWAQEMMNGPRFDSSLWFLAESGDKAVGAVIASPLDERIGFVDDLGVLPEARGRGIGKALLARALRALREAGFEKARLNVDTANETGALALYESVGMRQHRAWDVYEKQLDSS